jgi:molybdopterin-synthase adenylyltransferase
MKEFRNESESVFNYRVLSKRIESQVILFWTEQSPAPYYHRILSGATVIITRKEQDMTENHEQMMYARQLGLPGWGAKTQERLKQSTVFVAGNGGLGSPVMFYLAAAGIGTLIACDFDVIDITNLNRQILHTFDRIGDMKVESTRKTLHELNPYVTIIPVDKKITASNAAKLMGNADIIVDCLDNFETRHILNAVAVKKRIPMVHAGVAEMRGQVTFLQPPETPCLACIITEKKSRKQHILGATAGVIGSIQALEVLKYLSGIGTTLKNRLMFWDGVSMNFETISIAKNPRCKVCRNAG